MEKATKAKTITTLLMLRKSSSQFLYLIAIILFIVSIAIFIWMWIYAYMHDYIPDTTWGEKLGNHGPWRRLGFWRQGFSIRDAFWHIVNLQFYSMCLALISFFVKPNIRAIILFTITLVIFFVFLYTHYWLVD